MLKIKQICANHKMTNKQRGCYCTEPFIIIDQVCFEMSCDYETSRLQVFSSICLYHLIGRHDSLMVANSLSIGSRALGSCLARGLVLLGVEMCTSVTCWG